LAAWLISCALVAALGVFLAQAVGAQSIPSVPVTGPQAREAVYGAEVVPAMKVDALVRQQPLAYLESVAAAMRPNPPAFTVGKVIGLGMNPGCSDGVYLAGWVLTNAGRIQVKFDASTTLYDVTILPTMAGYPNTWTVCLPGYWQDGVEHRMVSSVLSSTGDALGALDNASATVPYLFTVGTAPAPAFTIGTIAVTSPGVIGGAVVAEAASVRLIVDGSEVAGALVPATSGAWSWTVPARLRDGKRHGMIDGSATGGGGGFHIQMAASDQ
jgi:hypothetical protein